MLSLSVAREEDGSVDGLGNMVLKLMKRFWTFLELALSIV
jgi:hypothetical protein